jgi:hypothetical protein
MVSPLRKPAHFVDADSTEFAVPAPVQLDPPTDPAVPAPVLLDQLTTNDAPLSPTLGEHKVGEHKADPSFCMSEDALSRIEAALRAQEKRHIPRAGQLPPVSGLPAVENEASPRTSTRAPTLSFQPSPPLAPERLQSIDADKGLHFNAQIFSIVLIAAAMSAALVYHFFTTEMSAEPRFAKVVANDTAPPPPPQAIEALVNHPTPNEASNQVGAKTEDRQTPQLPAPSESLVISGSPVTSESPGPAESPVISENPVASESPVSIAPVLARSVPIESTANTVVSSPIHHSRAGRHSAGRHSGGARSKSQ